MEITNPLKYFETLKGFFLSSSKLVGAELMLPR